LGENVIRARGESFDILEFLYMIWGALAFALMAEAEWFAMLSAVLVFINLL
jgi:hypothetical protein